MEAQAITQRTRDIGRFWRELSPGYKRLGLGLVAAAALSIALAVFLNRPSLVPLGQFEPKEAAAVTAKLTQLKVPYQPGPDGQTLMVNKNDLFTARLAVAQAGVGTGGITGYELFDKPQFGATDLEQKVNLQRALEGELTRALLRLNQVERANVRLAIPDRSPFVRNQEPPTAAVMLQLRPDAHLSSPEVSGLLRFISSAVPGLTPAGVTLIDDHGRSLADVAGLDDAGSGVQPSRQRLDLEKAMEGRILGLLEPVFGTGNVVAKVSVTLDTSKKTTQTRTYIPVKDSQGGVILSQETQRQTSAGTATPPAAAAAGAPTPPEYTTPGAGQNTSTDNTKTVTNYVVSEQNQTEVTQPGGVLRTTAGVVVNAAGGLSPDDIAQVRQTVAAALGAAESDITVTTMPFRQQSALQTLFNQPPPKPAGMPQWVLGAGAAVVLLFGLGLILLLRRRQPQPQTGWAELKPAEAWGAPAAAADAGAAPPEAAPRAAAAAAAPPQPPVNPESALPFPDLTELMEHDEPDLDRAEAVLAELLGEGSPVLVRPKAREQIEKAIRRRPDDAAAIITAWVQERRR